MEKPKTQAEFDALWRSLFPVSYTEPIEQAGNGRGLDPIAAVSAMFALFEQRTAQLTQAYYLLPHSLQQDAPAAGESKATTTIRIRRSAPANGPIVLVTGTVYEAVQRDANGVDVVVGEFVQTTDVTLADGAGGPIDVPVQANLAGYWGNVPAGSIRQFKAVGSNVVPATLTATSVLTRVPQVPGQPPTDSFLPTHTNRYARLVGFPLPPDPIRILSVGIGLAVVEDVLPLSYVGTVVRAEIDEWAAFGLTVEQPVDAVGGVSGFLDSIGTDRNTGRAPAMPDAPFRDQLSNLSDTISPGAIMRTIQQALTPLGWQLLETRTVSELKGCVYDLDPYDFGQVQPIEKVPGSELIGDGSVYLCTSALTKFFVVLVQPSPAGEFGGGYDSPMFPNTNAYDGPIFYDGYPVIFAQQLFQLWNALNAARAAGVGFMIARELGTAPAPPPTF